jgi:hypothetical protein
MSETEDLKDIINDLTLVVEMYIAGYPFDEDHKAKHHILVSRANYMIGKPRSLCELVTMTGISDKLKTEVLEDIKLNEQCHQCDYIFCSIRDSCVRYKEK